MNLKTNKLVIARDVIFDENEIWKVCNGEAHLKRPYLEVEEEIRHETLSTNEIIENHKIFQVHIAQLHHLLVHNKKSNK